jgi:hypothetical protein
MYAQDIELDFLEEFALATDRTAVVSKLVQGTSQHFLFGSLLSEQHSYPADVEHTLTAYRESHLYNSVVTTFNDRKAMKLYDASATAESPANAAALAVVRRGLGASLSHAQELPRFEAKTDDHIATVVSDIATVVRGWLLWGAQAWTRGRVCVQNRVARAHPSLVVVFPKFRDQFTMVWVCSRCR